jgi:hypothetical protein
VAAGLLTARTNRAAIGSNTRREEVQKDIRKNERNAHHELQINSAHGMQAKMMNKNTHSGEHEQRGGQV